MTTAQFSSATGTPVKTITKWLREGKLKGTKKSGKWAIPADQVNTLPTDESPQPKTETGGADIVNQTYSVAEFGDMTYLTQFGVSEWLRRGILTGHLDADGNWQVDATNLESDRIKRLLRD